MAKIINIENPLQHKVSEVVCLNCNHRWVATRPVEVKLKDLWCPKCNQDSYVIETGEDYE